MSDFSPSNGKLFKGIFAAIGALITYVAVPVFLVMGSVQLLEGSGADELVRQLGLHDMVMQVAALGLVITGLSFLRGFYPKGSKSRMTFGAASMAMVGIWLWVLLRGGGLTITMDEVNMAVDFLPILLLLLLGIAFRGLFFVAEMRSYRKEWLAQHA